MEQIGGSCYINIIILAMKLMLLSTMVLIYDCFESKITGNGYYSLCILSDWIIKNIIWR